MFSLPCSRGRSEPLIAWRRVRRVVEPNDIASANLRLEKSLRRGFRAPKPDGISDAQRCRKP